MERHYLDHASSSPLRLESRAALRDALEGGLVVGDPSRNHDEGRAVSEAIERAREHVAALVGARAREVVFCASGSEAANAAIFGAASRGGTIVTAPVEHAAVRRASARAGDVVDLRVDRFGRLDTDALEELLEERDDVGLVNCQWANHEVGTVQPVVEVVRLCRERGVLVHVDSCQAVGRLPVNFDELGADLLSFSGAKFGAPSGTGVLVVRRGLRLEPFVLGADQERARRAGLENLLGIVGLGAACAALAAPGALAAETAHEAQLAERLASLATAERGVTRLGDPVRCAPHLVALALEDVEAEAVVLAMNAAGIAIHSGSACSSESFEPSPVLTAMGVESRHSLRLSVGWSSSDKDVDAFARTFPLVLSELRRLAMT